MTKPDVKIEETEFGRSLQATAKFDMLYLSQEMFIKSMSRAADLIAEKYVAENYAKIVAHIDQQAIATLAIANAGAEISKTLKQEAATQTKVVETVKRELYQRGVFGGLTKL